ncbi:MAG: DNA-3-methyladenine glycosylase 2 family protein [Bryobacteraceae bacterium]|nr:DNA-3-methyladenine glycosylase 2 family protein [Bryobacteraceae bacterium]
MHPAIDHLRRADPVLGGLIERAGPYTIQYHPPVFATLAKSIVSQQLSGRAAATIWARVQAHARPRQVTPAAIDAATDEQLRACGLSAQKVAALRDLTARTLAGSVRFRALAAMPDDEVIAHLTPVRGVGVWTAHMFLIFALRRPDVLPTGDLGVRNAIARAYQLPGAPAPAEMEALAAPWRPFRSVASWYLWRSLENRAP